MKQLIVLLFVALVCQAQFSENQNFDSEEQSFSSIQAKREAGIQLSFTENSFTSVFEGVTELVQKAISNEKVVIEYKMFNISIHNINLTNFSLDLNQSSTKFLAQNKLRVQLYFQVVDLSLDYKFLLYGILPIYSGNMIFEDDHLSVSLDLAISRNRDNSTHFGITAFSFNPGQFEVSLKKGIIEFLINAVFGIVDAFLSLFKFVIDTTLQIFANQLFSKVPSQIIIPGTDIIFDTSLVSTPYISGSYMNIPLSGNSYLINSYSELSPIKQFNPESFPESTQLFIDQQVLNRLVFNLLDSNPKVNVTMPETPSPTTEVNSRSLVPILPGLKRFIEIYYPIFEVLLNSTSFSVGFSNNQVVGNAQVGLNFFWQQADKNETLFRYGLHPIYAKINFALDILSEGGFFTPRVLSVKVYDITVAPQDAHLFDLKQIESVIVFFEQVLKDALNLATFQCFVNLENVFGAPIQTAGINFEDSFAHVDIFF